MKNKKYVSKYLAAVALTAVAFTQVQPVNAYAEETIVTSQEEVTEEINDTETESIQEETTEVSTTTEVELETAPEEVTEAVFDTDEETEASSEETTEADGDTEEQSETTAEDTYVYATMNIPYGVFYESENTDIYYDAVTTATTSKFKMTDVLAKGTYNDGSIIRGVTYPVQLTEEDYSAITATQGEDEGADYYIYTDSKSEEAPGSYKAVDYENGIYTVSAAVSTVDTSEAASTVSVGGFTTISSYGDYQFDLDGVKTATTDGDGNTITPVSIGNITNVNVSAIILTTDGGKTYGMGMLENTWTGNRRPNVEIAVSIVEGQHLTNHGGAEFKTFEGLNGATITKVTILSNQGIFEVAVNQKLDPYYTGTEEVTAKGSTGDEAIEVNIPADFENPTVSVSYTEGSGRTAKTIYVAENAAVVDGKVAVSGALDFETNGSYTVLIQSDNYAAKSIILAAMMNDTQRATLEGYVTTGEAILDKNDTLATLKEHVEEAKALLQNEEATSDQANELIGELEILIDEAKVDIDTLNVNLSATSYTYNGKAQVPTVSVEGYTEDTDYTVEYSNKSSQNVGTYTVTIKGTGILKGSVEKEYTIKAKALASSNVTLSKTSYTYNGKVQTPGVTVKSVGTLKKDTDYTVSYTSGRKNVGVYTVTVKGKGNYSGTVAKTYTINPKGTSLSKVTASSKAFTATWTAQKTQTTGYQIQYSTSKTFSGAKSVTIKSTKTTKTTVKKLSAKKTYYVRVRTYKTVSGKTYYSSWSASKKVKTK